MKTFKTVDAVWNITETTHLFGLTLTETGKIVPPEGKLVTLVYNGENIPLLPGQYEGDVVLGGHRHIKVSGPRFSCCCDL